mmetsp:Transcript_21335/g.66564  ORF Transcript_21335/g.66564 Transcript_21335/m.66564 type:complete len:257 (-) Transcript_21335:107-877(-)
MLVEFQGDRPVERDRSPGVQLVGRVARVPGGVDGSVQRAEAGLAGVEDGDDHRGIGVPVRALLGVPVEHSRRHGEDARPLPVMAPRALGRLGLSMVLMAAVAVAAVAVATSSHLLDYVLDVRAPLILEVMEAVLELVGDVLHEDAIRPRGVHMEDEVGGPGVLVKYQIVAGARLQLLIRGLIGQTGRVPRCFRSTLDRFQRSLARACQRPDEDLARRVRVAVLLLGEGPGVVFGGQLEGSGPLPWVRRRDRGRATH